MSSETLILIATVSEEIKTKCMFGGGGNEPT